MRYHSFPRAVVAVAACLSAGLPACHNHEYDTETLSEASSMQGGTAALEGTSMLRATGGRSASLTTPFGSATGGSGGGNATARTGSFGGSSPIGGARAAGGASDASNAQTSAGVPSVVSSGTLGGSQSTGGTSTTSRINSAGGTNASGGSSVSNGSSTSAGTTSTTPVGQVSATEFSPYFYTWGWGNSAYAFAGLEDLKSKTQLKSVTLAFVLSDGQCVATTDIQDHLDDVNAFRSLGGHVKASFGGANGTYLENACSDAASLAKAISAFVTATNITDLDFDVEQSPAMDATVNARRAQALKLVQAEKGITVSFTLAATPKDKWGTPGGLSAASLSVLRATLDAQVDIARVNIMAMDYGSYFSSGNSMGTLAISALTDTLTQLKSLVPGLSDSAAWHRLGVTPMIGQNDVSTEVFSLDDARALISFAREKNLGLVSFWAINRDQPCPYNSLAVCSQVNTRNFEFSAIFAEVG